MPPIHSIARPLTAGLLLLGAASTATAQQSPARPDTARLGAVVVTATKSDAVAPTAAVTVLRGEELRARGIVSAADALREVAGVHLARSGARGATTSFFLRGGQSNYVKVLVDGVPVNDAGGFVDLANLTTDNVERIEIVRGPASVLYGSDAVSGVVQLFSRRASAPLAIDARVRAGSAARKLGPADTTGGSLASRASAVDASVDAAGRAGALGWSLGAAHHGHQGTLRFNNAWRNQTLSAALHAEPDARSSVRLSARHVDARFAYPTNGAGRAVDSNAVREERRLLVGLDGARELSRVATLHVAAAMHQLDALSSDQPDSPGDDAGYYYRTVNDNFRRTAESRLDLRAGTALVTAGVEAQWQGEDSRGESRFGSFESPPSTFVERRRNVGYFAQAAGDVGALDYTAGARVDDNEKFGTFGTWRVGSSFALASLTRLRAAAGTAFKEPSFLEVFSTAFTNGNEALRPERSLSWELGIEHALPVATLSATWFDQRFRDMIQYRPRPMGATEPHYFNIARASARGLELEARTDAARALSASASLTAVRTRVEDAGFQTDSTANFVRGERLLRRPSLSGALTVAWRPLAWTRLSLTTTHVGERGDRSFGEDFVTRRVTLPAHTTLDLAGEVDLLDARRGTPLALTLRADNALNASFQEIAGYVAPGRTLYVGLRARLSR